MTQLDFPIKSSYQITQNFGEDRGGYYAKYGMKGHNGVDIACPTGTGIYACADGYVLRVIDGVPENNHSGYGNMVALRISDNQPNRFLEVLNGHMLPGILVKQGDFVEKGQLLGFVNNTGDSTGPHDHWAARWLERRAAVAGEGTLTIDTITYTIPDYSNGFLGYIDPKQFLQVNPPEVVFPVDKLYGEEYSWIREQKWSTLYNEKKVYEQALKAGFSKSELPRFKAAFVYGYWDKDFIFKTENFAIWAHHTKPGFKKLLNQQ